MGIRVSEAGSWLNVHASNVETGVLIPLSGPAFATEQVE
jgi:hypothetical protein